MHREIAIRRARAADHDMLEAVEWRAGLALDEYRDQLLAHPDVIHVPPDFIDAGRVLVAEVDDEIAGFAAWLPVGDGVAELDGLFVDPALWRRGIGRRLIRALRTAVRDEDMDLIFVVANPGAEAFYRHCDFVRTGEADTQFGQAFTMELDMRKSAYGGAVDSCPAGRR